MIRATQIALLAVLIALVLAIGAVAWVAWDIHRLIVQTDSRLNSPAGILARAAGLETKANATLINLDKGTAIWADSAKDQAGAIEDLATDAHGTLSEANQTIQSVRPVTAAIADELGALHQTTDQATALTAALTVDAQTANGTIAAGRPLLEGLARNSDSLEEILKDQAIRRTFAATATTAEQLAALSTDIHIYTHPILNPDPCTTKGCVAKRVVAQVGGYLSIAATGANAAELFRPIPVKLKK